MARKDFARSSRVAQEVQRLLNTYLQRELDDEQLRLTSLTHVKVSSDLSHARVYWRCLLSEFDRDDLQERFKENAKRLRHYLSKDMHIRKVPELKFFYDETIDHAAHMDKLLAKTHELSKQVHPDVLADDSEE